MRLTGFAARRRVIAPAFLLALALNHDLYLAPGPERLPLALPRDVSLPATPAAEFAGGWAGAPVPPALAPKVRLRAIALVPEPDWKARREAIEKRLRGTGATTPAYIALRALAELGAPYAKIARALETARRKDDPAEQRKLLEGALGVADSEDLITRERLLRLLSTALARAGQVDAARSRAKEADELVKRIAQIELAEFTHHPQLEPLVARRQALLAKLPAAAPNVPGLSLAEDAKRMAELRAKIKTIADAHPPDEAAR